MDFITEYMGQFFDEMTPHEFYRAVFPKGELQERGSYEKGKYNGVAVEILPLKDGSTKQNAKRFVITDDLFMLDKLLESDNFIIVSPISYKGKARTSENARFIYGLAIDLDGLESKQNITDLFYQMEGEITPRPTITVTSGSGLHLYYLFEKPLPAFDNICRQLHTLKTGLVRKIWNRYVTTLWDKPQYQSIFQGFRLVGGVTKDGSRTKAYWTGERVTVEYLNDFVLDEYQMKEFTYKSNLTLSVAKEKFPEWYEKRIEKKQKKGTWVCKRDLYDWWKRRVLAEASEGHRYFAIMCLAIYAKKSGIEYKELEKDAFGLIPHFEYLTTNEDNHFTEYDCMKALELYNDDYITFPIEEITKLTLIPIERNKRNGRKQSEHLQADFWQGEKGRPVINVCKQNRELALKYMRDNNQINGRPTKIDIVEQWQQAHPDGTKADCCRETGLSRPTVYKYWKG